MREFRLIDTNGREATWMDEVQSASMR